MTAPLQHLPDSEGEALCGAPHEIRLTFFASTFSTVTCSDCITARFEKEPSRPLTSVAMHPPNTEVVLELEALLEQAKSGDLRSFAFAGLHKDGLYTTTHVGTSDMLRVVGAMRRLEHEILTSVE